MGPWTHGGYELSYAGDFYFGNDAAIDYNDLKLTWFDHHLKGFHTEVADWPPVQIFIMGTGDGGRAILGAPNSPNEYPGRINHGGHWRGASDWPLPGTNYRAYYLHGDGTLSATSPDESVLPPSTYTFDPTNPVPTIGGGISAAETIMRAGAFDQREGPEFLGSQGNLPLNLRRDVLTFQTMPLGEDLEVTGPIEVHLFASSTSVDTDFTAKLIDVFPPSSDYPEGLAFNITDSILRGRYRNGWTKPEFMIPGQSYEFVFELYPTSNLFKK